MIAACVKGSEPIASRLLFAGADFHTKSENYGSALYAACAGGYVEIVQKLLDRDADINQPCGPSNSYSYPLIAACFNGHDRIVELLVRKGANLNVTTDHGDCRHALPAACHSCGTATVLHLLEHGCGVKGKSTYFDRALYDACSNEEPRAQLIQLLRRTYKANPNVRFKDTEHGYALIAACSNGDATAVRLLLENEKNSAKVNVKFQAETPLMAACSARSPEVVEMLIHNGVDVNQKFGKYTYPLISALFGGGCGRNGDQETASLLVNNQANLALAGQHSLHRCRRNEKGSLADIERVGDKGVAPGQDRLVRTSMGRDWEDNIDPVLSELVQEDPEILHFKDGPEKHLERAVKARGMPRVLKILEDIVSRSKSSEADTYQLDILFNRE